MAKVKILRLLLTVSIFLAACDADTRPEYAKTHMYKGEALPPYTMVVIIDGCEYIKTYDWQSGAITSQIHKPTCNNHIN